MAARRRRARTRAAPARRAGEQAGPLGEQVPALIARDRAGHTVDAVLPDLGAEAIGVVLGPSSPTMPCCARTAPRPTRLRRRARIHHEPINLAAGVRVRDGAFHIQNVNAYHGRLKGWMGRFNGVATRYLPNYLGWRRTLERAPEPSASRTWLLAAARQITRVNAN